MTRQDVDVVVKACIAWVAQHHRAKLTPAEGAEIRNGVMFLFRSAPHAPELAYVQLAHKLANQIVTRRRDQVQLGEHARMVRA